MTWQLFIQQLWDTYCWNALCPLPVSDGSSWEIYLQKCYFTSAALKNTLFTKQFDENWLADVVVAVRQQRGWFPRRCANKVKRNEYDNGNVSNVDSDDEPCSKKDE